MIFRIYFTASGDDNRMEVCKVNTDFSGAETQKGMTVVRLTRFSVTKPKLSDTRLTCCVLPPRCHFS